MVEKNKGFQVGAHIAMVILSLCCIFPFLLLIMSSITDEQELIRNGYTLFPKALSLNAYQYMFKSSNKIISAYGITILSTVVGTLCGLSMTILMAYPLSRRDLPGRNGLAFYVFFTMLFSGGLVPTYIMYTRYIKVSNTIWALIIPSLMVNAFYVIMMRTYFSTNIPEAVIEAARIDGAGRMRTMLQILLPLTLPGLVAVGIYTFLNAWDDYLMSMTIMQVNNMKTLPVGLAQSFLGEYAHDYGALMAFSMAGSLPIVLLFVFFQKYMVSGLTAGAVKG